MTIKQKQITWLAPEFIHYPKSLFWFVIVIVMGLGLLTYFLFQKDFLTATLFALLLLTVLYFSKTKSKTVHIMLSSQGIKLNNTKLSYQQIKSFWIVYEPPEVKTLNFETTAYLNHFLTLQLSDQNPVEIREFLLQYLPEDLDRGEQFADKLARKLKF